MYGKVKQGGLTKMKQLKGRPTKVKYLGKWRKITWNKIPFIIINKEKIFLFK